jgi:hypothetical protein
MSIRGTETIMSSFPVTQRNSVRIKSTMGFSNSLGLKDDDQKDGQKDIAVGRWGECPRRRSMVATLRPGILLR